MLGIFLQPESYTAPTVTVASEFNLWYFKYYSFLGVHQKNNRPSHSCFHPSSSIITTIHKSLIDQFLSLLFPRIFICFFLDQANPFCVSKRANPISSETGLALTVTSEFGVGLRNKLSNAGRRRKKRKSSHFYLGFRTMSLKMTLGKNPCLIFSFKNRLIVP